MKFLFTAFLISFSWNLCSQIKVPIAVEISNFTIGETITLYSSALDEVRTINVYLPHGYSKDSSKVYPVIYLLDGSADEDFIHISGLVQFGSFSWINMVPESIVIGISNIDRKKDYTFETKNKEYKEEFPTSGESANFIHYLEEEIKPLVEKSYHVSDTSTLIGQSLGGLLATEILFKKPNLFNNYIIVSPSLWWDDGALLEITPEPYKSHKNIIIAVGKEGKIMEQDAKKLYKKLKKAPSEQATLYFKFLKHQNHGDALHLSVYFAFEKMYQQTNTQK